MSIACFSLDLKLQTAQCLHHDSKKLKKAVYQTSENELLDVFYLQFSLGFILLIGTFKFLVETNMTRDVKHQTLSTHEDYSQTCSVVPGLCILLASSIIA